MEKMDIKTKLAIIMMTYADKGRLTKFTDKVYGFCNSDGTVNIVDLHSMKVIEKPFSISYILDRILILHHKDINNLNFMTDYILNIDTFEIIEESQYRLSLVSNIVYESNNITMYNHGEEILVRKIYNELGENIGEIKAYSDLSIENIEGTDYYIAKHTKVGETKETVAVYKINKDVKLIWESDEYDVANIADGIYSFSRYSNYKDTKVYNFYKKELAEI